MYATTGITLARAVGGLLLMLSALAACYEAPTSPYDQPTTAVASFCSGLEPAWVAFQDGDGAWTQVQPTVTGQRVTFRHTFTTNRGTIATARRSGPSSMSLSIQYGAPAELASVGDTTPAHCDRSPLEKLLGTVAGLDANDVAVVSAGFNVRAAVFPGVADPFELRDLISGPQDILATRSTRVGDAVALTGVILRRSPELPDGATMPVLDFGSPEAFAPAARTVTFTGLDTDGTIAHTRFRTSRSENIIAFLTGNASAVNRSFHAIPAELLEPGDLQALSATTTAASDNGLRSATVWFRTPVDRTLALGARVDAPVLDLEASAPTLRVRARFAAQADYDRSTVITFQQEQTIVSVAMTSTYATLSGRGFELVVPELTGVPGFDPGWALRPGVAMLWTAARIGGTLGLGPNAVPADGTTQRIGVMTGGFVP